MNLYLHHDHGIDLEELQQRAVPAHSLPGIANQQCSICLDPIQGEDTVVTLECDHTFHSQCIVRWLGEHSTCPLCRDAQPTTRSTTMFRLNMDVYLLFVFQRGTRYSTRWTMNDTLIDVLQYLLRTCYLPSQNISVRIGENTFKTTESFQYLNQTLGELGIIGEHEAHVSVF